MSQTLRFSALDCGFRVTTDNHDVATYLASLFRHLGPPSDVRERHYVITAEGGGSVAIRGDGMPLAAAASRPPLRALVRDIDEHIIANSPRLLIHASGVVYRGHGVAFAGTTGAGKSTLAAGLVRAGFGYLTDEFVSPDWDTGEVPAYPRAISLPRGSWDALGTAAPSLPASLGPLLEGAWQVDPVTLRPNAVVASARLSHVFFPTCHGGAPTEAVPMSRADALVEISNRTFHFHSHGARAFRSLAAVLRDCACYRLTVGTLGEACRAVQDVVADAKEVA